MSYRDVVKQAAFAKRLHRCVERANLRTADVARWFKRPDATVRSWLFKGVMPAGGPLDKREVMTRLKRLEQAIAKRRLPLPRLPPHLRIEHIERMRDDDPRR